MIVGPSILNCNSINNLLVAITSSAVRVSVLNSDSFVPPTLGVGSLVAFQLIGPSANIVTYPHDERKVSLQSL